MGEDAKHGKYVYSVEDPSIFVLYKRDEDVQKARRKVRRDMLKRNMHPYIRPTSNADAIVDSGSDDEPFSLTKLTNKKNVKSHAII